MITPRKIKFVEIASLILATVFWSAPALAYLDPGSGSAIMSAIIGAVVAGFLGIKTYWYKLKSIFFGKKKSLDNDIDGGSSSKE